MSAWPRLTPVQKQTLEDFEKAKHGELCVHSLRALKTVWVLKSHGMLDGGTSNWFRITQRGRDYVRFVIHKIKEGDLEGDLMTATQKKIIKQLKAGFRLRRSQNHYLWCNQAGQTITAATVNKATLEKMRLAGLVRYEAPPGSEIKEYFPA